jgi:hypothetical protein
MLDELELEELELEGECLNKVFAGSISTLRGISELIALGVPEEEAKSLVYRAAALGIRRRLSN